jgi:hypothetical protein
MLPGLSQSKKKRKKNKKSDKEVIQSNAPGPTSIEPYYPQKFHSEKNHKKSKAKFAGPTYNAEQKFYERMEKLAKERRKLEKEMKKPEYSNPMYFGHKRLPKKHKPGKMKYCNVCGIRH